MKPFRPFTGIIVSVACTFVPATAAAASLVCPRAIAAVPFLPPDDRPTTADCYVDGSGVQVALSAPDVRVIIPAGPAVVMMTTRGELIAVRDSRGTEMPGATGRLIAFDDPAGAHVAITFNAAARVTKVSATDGDTFVNYSADRVTSIVAPGGATRSFVYDATDALSAVADADGSHTISYDAAGRVTQAFGVAVARNAVGAIISAASFNFLYDVAGRVSAVSDGTLQTSFAYDARGTLMTASAAGAIWSYVRNGLGLALSASDGTHTWSFAYDANQRLAYSSSPTGQAIHRTYDARGDLASVLDSNGLVAFSRDDFGRVLRVSYADATASTISYAAPALQTVCPHAFLGTFAAPEEDRPTADDCFITLVDGVRVFLNGSFSIPAPLNPGVAAFRLRSSGAVLALANGRGDDAQVMSSDALASIASPIGRAATLQHNAFHIPVRVTDALGAATAYAYDSDGRMTVVTDAVGAALHFGWTAIGRLLSVTDANAGVIASFTYDATGRLLSATDGLGIVTAFVWSADHPQSILYAAGDLTSLLYNSGGQLVRATHPSGAAIEYAYDTAGDLTSVTDGIGRTWSYVHDSAGNLTEYLDGLNHAVSFTYDANGNRVSKLDQLSHLTTFAYDAFGDRVSSTDPAGDTTSFAYNAHRSTTAIVDPVLQTTSFSYVDFAGAGSAIDDLTAMVRSLQLSKGLTTALTAKLQTAETALAAGDTATACGSLADFVAQVRAKTGKDLSVSQAEALIDAATQIRSMIAC